MPNKQTKMTLAKSNSGWKVDVQELSAGFLEVEGLGYFAYTHFTPVSARGTTMEEALQVLRHIIMAQLIGLAMNGQIEDEAKKNGWELHFEDDNKIVILAENVRISIDKQGEKKVLYDLDEGREAEITNPEILEEIRKLEAGEYDSQLLELDMSRIKNAEDFKNAILHPVHA